VVQLPLLPLLYGIDIETDTSVDGLDPARSRVIAVAVSGPDGDMVWRGAEPALLQALDAYLAHAPPGVLVTWNGSGFDLPFLAERARRNRLRLGLRIRPDPSLAPRHPPLGGAHPWRARWHRHLHLDALAVYRSLVAPGESCALKALARRHGLEPVEADPRAVHTLEARALERYVASDARLARLLAEAAWLDAGDVLDVPDGRPRRSRRPGPRRSATHAATQPDPGPDAADAQAADARAARAEPSGGAAAADHPPAPPAVLLAPETCPTRARFWCQKGGQVAPAPVPTSA
jgi:hypothetical protein